MLSALSPSSPAPTSAARLATILHHLNYPATTPTTLAPALEWAFAFPDTKPVLEWLCEAFADADVEEGQWGARRKWSVLDGEEVDAYEELRKKGFVSHEGDIDESEDEEANTDLTSLDELRSQITALEADLQRTETAVKTLTEQQGLLTKSKNAIASKTTRLRHRHAEMDTLLNEMELELGNVSLRLDAAISETSRMTATLAALAHPTTQGAETQPPPYLFLATAGLSALRSVTEAFEDTVKHAVELIWGKTGDVKMHKLLRHPFPRAPELIDPLLSVDTRAEIERLGLLYPITERGYVSAKLRCAYSSAQLDALRTPTHQQQQQQHERDTDRQTLRATVTAAVEEQLAPLWTEIARLRVRARVAEAFVTAAERRRARELEHSQQVLDSLVATLAGTTLVTHLLVAEKAAVRAQAHIVQAVRDEFRNLLDTTRAGAGSGTHAPRDVLAPHVKRLLGADATGEPKSGLAGWLRTREQTRGADGGVAEGVDDLDAAVAALLRLSEEHATSKTVLLAPKVLYDIQDAIRTRTGDVGRRVAGAAAIAEEFSRGA
ncbi:uncharacterized protein EV422DRAFT_286117 [Fimicolochytrium jonesii]|uniref:uncharacterized protein n=1 Tax=Fimicolochytrium jonesii TaxID=1396493 RepID=UPI0022FE9731|nr:uncharacterized protein EV422DRAFT_286117 [Fimicolochytrium jonesii]KAI8816513.1 hypothetical protein EV422DRAFT_286117 [Fimicolochytrium jonesii]